MQVAERPHDLLHLLPRGAAGADLGLERVGDVESVRAPGRAAEAQGEMGTMLRPVFTVAPRPAAAAVRLGQGAEHDLGGQLVKPPQEPGPRPQVCRHR